MLGHRHRAVALAVLGALALSCRPRPPVARPRPAAGVASLRLLTYNVNFGIAGDASTVAAIRDARADLALLQETSDLAEDRGLRSDDQSRSPGQLRAWANRKPVS